MQIVKNLSINRKIMLIMLTFLGFFLILGGHTILREREVLMELAKERGKMITAYLAEISGDAIKNYDFDLIHKYLMDVAKDEEIAFATVYDAGNNVLATTRDELRDKGIAEKESLIVRPIRSETLGEIGRIETTLSFRKVNEQIWRRALNYTIFFILAGMVVGFVARRIALAITRPLHLLIEGIEKVRKGDLDFKVQKVSRDEIGLVGQAFNEMREKLKETLGELQHHRQHLEVLVERRTAELEKSNSDLLEAQEELLCQKDEIEKNHHKLVETFKQLKQSQSTIVQQEKMASLGQLAAGVAHEINNPVGFIMSNMSTMAKYIDRLKEFDTHQSGAGMSGTTPESPEELQSVRKKLKVDYIFEDLPQLVKESLEGAERVKEIVQNLKAFSRLDEAGYKLADINECLESTLKIVWNELKYKCTVVKEYGELPLTLCSAQQLNQVFVNLLVNASHAIEKHGEITIRTWEEKSAIHVAISDTGCGIPEENLNRLFEPFFTTKEIGKGTGLGLSIVYDIVTKNHKGEITVTSEVGRGSIFTISLPVVEG